MSPRKTTEDEEIELEVERVTVKETVQVHLDGEPVLPGGKTAAALRHAREKARRAQDDAARAMRRAQQQVERQLDRAELPEQLALVEATEAIAQAQRQVAAASLSGRLGAEESPS